MVDRLTQGTAQEQRKGNVGRLTGGLRDDLEFYFLSCRSQGLRPATLRSYRKNLDCFVRFLESQGVHSAENVAPVHFRLWMLDLEQRMQLVSVRDYVSVARTWFKWLYTERIITTNPAQDIKSPRVRHKVMAIHQQDGLQAMLEVCDYDARQDSVYAWLGLRNKAMMLVLTTTGMRESELVGMRLAHFLMDYSRIKVVEAKNGCERVVALDQKVQQVVLRYLLARKKLGVSHDYVWVGRRGRPLHGDAVYRALRKVGARAGVHVPRFIHAFRHTAGTRAMLNGASQREAGDMLGHKTDYMTRRYTQHIGSEQAAERHASWAPTKGLRIT